MSLSGIDKSDHFGDGTGVCEIMQDDGMSGSWMGECVYHGVFAGHGNFDGFSRHTGNGSGNGYTDGSTWHDSAVAVGIAGGQTTSDWLNVISTLKLDLNGSDITEIYGMTRPKITDESFSNNIQGNLTPFLYDAIVALAEASSADEVDSILGMVELSL